MQRRTFYIVTIVVSIVIISAVLLSLPSSSAGVKSLEANKALVPAGEKLVLNYMYGKILDTVIIEYDGKVVSWDSLLLTGQESTIDKCRYVRAAMFGLVEICPVEGGITVEWPSWYVGKVKE